MRSKGARICSRSSVVLIRDKVLAGLGGVGVDLPFCQLHCWDMILRVLTSWSG